MKNFHSRTLHHPIEPLYIYLNPNDFDYLTVKVNVIGLTETIDYIKHVFNKFSPHYPSEFNFFDEQFERAYHSEQKMAEVFSVFAILAILISCMGLFGLVLYAIEQRIKEIGIRKTLGAGTFSIFILLSKEFYKWILIANIIAWPVAWYLMTLWLQNFTYKVNIEPVLFLFATALTLLIALLTMSYQTIKASISDPVVSLRYE